MEVVMEPQDQSMDIPRPELINKVKDFLHEAKKMPLSELCKTGDYKNQPDLKYPQTKAEYLAYSMLNLLLDQSWLEPDTDPLLDEILNELSSLDMGVNSPKTWQELFKLSEELESLH